MKAQIKILIFLTLLVLVIVPSVSALSNESIQAKKLLDQAKQDILQMQSRGIPITRANETFQEGLQLYAAQVALEEKSRTADYKLVNSQALTVSQIKDTAIKADDELRVFQEAYNEASRDVNLSEMSGLYDDIQRSFKEERFEDTLQLIDQGYAKMSEVQASQTAAKVFARAISGTLTNFFKENWRYIASIGGAIIILIIFFWRTILKVRVKLKINNLNLQKKTLSNLIKKLQTDYFKLGKISETEYKVKSEKFKEMIRDIDRQIPLLKEEMLKIDKNKIKKFDIKTEKILKSSENSDYGKSIKKAGLGGWLLLYIILLILLCIEFILITTFGWINFLTSYPALFSLEFILPILYALITLYTFYILVLTFRKRENSRIHNIIINIIGLIFSLLSMGLLILASNSDPAYDYTSFMIVNFITALLALIFIFYWIISKRVKNTFVK